MKHYSAAALNRCFRRCYGSIRGYSVEIRHCLSLQKFARVDRSQNTCFGMVALMSSPLRYSTQQGKRPPWLFRRKVGVVVTCRVNKRNHSCFGAPLFVFTQAGSLFHTCFATPAASTVSSIITRCGSSPIFPMTGSRPGASHGNRDDSLKVGGTVGPRTSVVATIATIIEFGATHCRGSSFRLETLAMANSH